MRNINKYMTKVSKISEAHHNSFNFSVSLETRAYVQEEIWLKPFRNLWFFINDVKYAKYKK
jgi:hypothetical protein